MPLRIEPVRDRKLHRLVQAAEPRAIRKGEVVYRRGDTDGRVYVVREGYVCLRLGRPAGEGGDRTVAIAGPAELFGEEAMVPGAPRPYAAIAGERGTVLALEGAAVRSVLRGSHPTLTAYLDLKEKDLALLRSAATGSPGPSARGRLAAVLLDLVARLGRPDGDGTALPHRFTHREFADLSGTHRSTVTTCLNDWIWRGVLETRGRELRLPPGGAEGLREEIDGGPAKIDRTPRQD